MESKLKAFFTEEELEWRVQSCGLKKDGTPWAMVLCYIQARAVQQRLDDTVGWDKWKDEYRKDGNGTLCRLAIYSDKRDEWVAKENGADETDIEATKGGISGAFKRVASSGFGIGRYLYDLDATFAVCSLERKKGWTLAKTRDGKYIYWETPKMPAKFLPKAKPKKSIFQQAKDALRSATTETRYDEAWSNVKKRKKEFAEEDWAELEKIGGEEKGKHVSGTK